MNDKKPIEYIDESILLEENAAELYLVFSESIPEDTDFWRQLHLEEKRHAMLIRSAKDAFVQRGKFPYDLIAESGMELRQANARLRQLIAKYRQTPPSRKEACEIALTIEADAGESEYARFMDKHAESTVDTVFQMLNREDKEHERRIREHLETFAPAEPV